MSRGSRLKTFDQCSRTKKLVVILISGFLLLVLGYSVDLNFLQKSLRLKQKELGMIKELLQTKKKELRPEKLMRSLEPSLSEICIANSSSSIPKQGIIDILHGIERVMILSRVEAAFFEPQAVTANEIMVIYPVKFAVTGQYKNLLTFINNLLKQPYFVVIEELMVQKMESMMII